MKIVPENLAEKVTIFRKKPVRVVELFIGILFVRNWIKLEDHKISIFNDELADDVLQIYKENFTEIHEDRFLKYAQYFNNICYVYRDDEAVKGYCFFFAEPVFSSGGMKKLCTVYSIAVDDRYRRQGVAESLLRKGIREMKMNGIDRIMLYVEINNQSAIRLYMKLGFRTIGEVRDICSPGDRCYEMVLDLKRTMRLQ